MRKNKAQLSIERQRAERLLETGRHAQAISSAVDTLIEGTNSPDVMTRVRCARAILMYSNKAKERELRKRLDNLEQRLKGASSPVQVFRIDVHKSGATEKL
jgi:hypothetical protein